MSKSIGIIAATKPELAPMLERLSEKKIKCCISGIGAASATYNIFQFIQSIKPVLLIQAGIGGCFDNSVSLSSVFIIEQDRFADLGVVENNEWKDVFDMQLADADQAPYNNGWLINNHTKQYNPNNLQTVNAISVNEVVTCPQKIKWFKQKYNPVIESMEGAAFHYVCLKQKIPFLQLRGVSNYLGERNKSKWEIEKAIISVNKELIQMLEYLGL